MSAQIIKRPIRLILTCILGFCSTAFLIYLYTDFGKDVYSPSFALTWASIMISLNIVAIAGIVLMFFLKRIGLWLYVAAKISLFAVPFIAGTGDSVLGLLTPILLAETAIFMVFFSNHVKYMR
jgi:hypothetical protein